MLRASRLSDVQHVAVSLFVTHYCFKSEIVDRSGHEVIGGVNSLVLFNKRTF
jgi:hypothetical protein